MTMKTASTIFNLVAILISFIYTWALLTFIHAPFMLWALFAISLCVAVTSSLLSIWARDEYYAEQFLKVVKKVAVEGKREAA